MAEGYAAFFQRVTGNAPFPFQVVLGERRHEVVAVPTGFGKTEGVVVPWLYAHHAGRQVTTRLFYCLPMRVLVEQIHQRITGLVEAAELSDGVGVRKTLGGARDDSWVHDVTKPTIVVGTIDLLVSRALNRGYAAGPGMWPTYFAACHNDATWVLDEVQLLGAALPTSLQLQAFRDALGTFGPTKTVWMSATVPSEGLATVDHPPIDRATWLRVSQDDTRHERLGQRWRAAKRGHLIDDPLTASAVVEAHRQAQKAHGNAALTLVVVNTIKTAQALYNQLDRTYRRATQAVPLALLHSRFRPPDRRARTEHALGAVAGSGGIIVATQVIEAGVDLDASALVTELCPWPSLVQRLGRVNRRGDLRSHAEVRIHGPLSDEALGKQDGRPYPAVSLRATRDLLRVHEDLSPAALAEIQPPEESAHWAVLRRADLLQLFDTTPSLEGDWTSVAQWVRDVEQVGVWIGWRVGSPEPDQDEPALARDELCPVPLAEARQYAKDRPLWSRNRVDGAWARVQGDDIRPGMDLRADAKHGGYTADGGWSLGARTAVPPAESPQPETVDDRVQGDAEAFPTPALTLAQHSLDARSQAARLCTQEVSRRLDGLGDVVVQAAWLHDIGKAHEQYQQAIRKLNADLDEGTLYAKSGRDGRLDYQDRRFFRHEVASALRAAAALEATEIDCATPDLLVYLVGAHHGKARMGLPLWRGYEAGGPGEHPHQPSEPAVAGLRDGDPLPEIDCGDGLRLRAWVIADLDGWSHQDGGRWAAIARRLLTAHGPFRLAYLEWLVRAADWAASRDPGGMG